MNYSTAIFLISDKVRAINIAYEPKDARSGDCYTYKTMDPTIKEGDYVVIPTDSRHKMTIGKVLETDLDLDLEDPTEIKWIIDRVHLRLHKHSVQQETNSLIVIKSAEKRKKRDELKETLMKDTEGQITLLDYNPNETPDFDSEPTSELTEEEKAEIKEF